MAIGDQQQYNRLAADAEAANAANALTSTLLLARDAKRQTADSNGNGSAPVNPSVKTLAQMVAGLRGALFGNVTGIAKRTLKGIYADLTGGVTHTKPAGTITASGPAAPGTAIEAESGDIKASNGDVLAIGDMTASGDITGAAIFWGSITGVAAGGQALIDSLVSVGLAGAERLLHGATRLTWTVTSNGASGSNPPSTTATKNQLRALNTPKAWVSFTTDGSVGADCIVSDGHGIASVTRTTAYFSVTLASNFDSVEYAVVSGTTDLPGIWVNVTNKAVGACRVEIRDTIGIKDPVNVDTTRRIDLLFMGRQTT